MEASVYIDVFFFTNFIADYILIYIVGNILKSPLKIRRKLSAAFMGAFLTSILYCFFPELGWKTRIFVNMGIGFSMIYLAFPKKTWIQKLKILGLLCGVTSFIGGVFLWIYYETPVGYTVYQFFTMGEFFLLLFTSMVLIVIFFRLLYGMQREMKLILDVTFSYQGKNVSTRGLLDTGNDLVDPVTGRPVFIVEYSIFETILEAKYKETIEEFLKYETINLEQIMEQNLYDIKVISYHSIGKQNGKLIGVQIEQLSLKIEGEEHIIKKPVLAFVKNPLSRKRNYFAILNRRGIL